MQLIQQILSWYIILLDEQSSMLYTYLQILKENVRLLLVYDHAILLYTALTQLQKCEDSINDK